MRFVECGGLYISKCLVSSLRGAPEILFLDMYMSLKEKGQIQLYILNKKTLDVTNLGAVNAVASKSAFQRIRYGIIPKIHLSDQYGTSQNNMKTNPKRPYHTHIPRNNQTI